MYFVELNTMLTQKKVRDMNKIEQQDVCRAKSIAHNLIEIADRNEKSCESDTCILIYGLLRDCGYRIERIIGEDALNGYEC